jgi:hypothetical protein
MRAMLMSVAAYAEVSAQQRGKESELQQRGVCCLEGCAAVEFFSTPTLYLPLIFVGSRGSAGYGVWRRLDQTASVVQREFVKVFACLSMSCKA